MATANQADTGHEDRPAGKLVAVIVAFMFVAAGSALYIWWTLDEVLAGRPRLVPSIVGLVVIAVFLFVLRAFGKFVREQMQGHV